jgi:hypothetical protein
MNRRRKGYFIRSFLFNISSYCSRHTDVRGSLLLKKAMKSCPNGLGSRIHLVNLRYVSWKRQLASSAACARSWNVRHDHGKRLVRFRWRFQRCVDETYIGWGWCRRTAAMNMLLPIRLEFSLLAMHRHCKRKDWDKSYQTN